MKIGLYLQSRFLLTMQGVIISWNLLLHCWITFIEDLMFRITLQTWKIRTGPSMLKLFAVFFCSHIDDVSQFHGVVERHKVGWHEAEMEQVEHVGEPGQDFEKAPRQEAVDHACVTR